jgi:hypothetical protein
LGSLGHDAFKPAFLGFPEELSAGLFAMLADHTQTVPRGWHITAQCVRFEFG